MRDWRLRAQQRVIEFEGDGEVLVYAALYAPVEVLVPLNVAFEARRLERRERGLPVGWTLRCRKAADRPVNERQFLDLLRKYRDLPGRPACRSLEEFLTPFSQFRPIREAREVKRLG